MIFKLKKIKRRLPIILGLFLGVFLFGSAALALDVGLQYGTATGLGTADLRVGIMQIVRYALGFLGVLAILIMLYGGFVWMTSGGNVQRIEVAKKILINGVIGLVIIFSSFMLASFIIRQLELATGAGGGGPVPCSPNGSTQSCPVPGCANGQQTCTTGFWGACVPPAGCIPINQCGVVSIYPAAGMSGLPNNVAITVRLNHDISAGDPRDVKIYVGDREVTSVDRTVEGAVITIESTNPCAPPWETRKCLAANTTYEVRVDDTGSLQCGGLDLKCGLDGCRAEFTTGDFVDTENPTINLIDTQICKVPDNVLQAQVNDDYGIREVRFKDDDNNASIGVDTDVAGSLPQIASVTWDTSGSSYVVGTRYTVSAETDDAAQNTVAATPLPYQLRAATCCNNVKDGDETGIDCGGSCESCNPVIEWFDPPDGAVNSMITIHGRHFGAAVGSVKFADATTQPAVVASLPACVAVWQDTEIIALVPAGANNGPIEVTRTDLISDRTDQPPGSSLANFEVSTTARPGLCSVQNTTNPALGNSGYVNDITKLQGINFVSGQSSVYFAQWLAGGTPVVLSATQINGAKVPAVRSGELGVRVQDSAKVCVGGDHNGDPCLTASQCLPGGECKNILSNSVSFKVLAEPVVPQAQCTIADAAVYLDGVDDYFVAPPPNSKSASFEFWVRPEDVTPGTMETVLEWADLSDPFYLVLGVDSAGDTWEVKVGTTNHGGSYVFNQGEWYHLLLSLNTSAMVGVLYINGEAQPSFTLPAANLPGTNYGLYVGSKLFSFSGQFKGALDDFAIYRRALSGVEALHLSQQRRLADDALVSLWRFNNNLTNSKSGGPDISFSGGTVSYTSGHFPCTETISCDGNTSTAECNPLQSLCPTGTACDPNACGCVPAQACDSDPITPACQAGTCPSGLFCDGSSNCTCQPKDQNLQDSTYAWTFSTTAFGPYVVEKCNRTGDCSFDTITSPTPFSREGTNLAGYAVSRGRPDDGAVPIDSAIAGQFSTRMYRPSLVATGDSSGTVRVLRCNQGGGFNPNDCTIGNTDVVPSDFQMYDCGSVEAPADCFKFVPPSSRLQPDTWYEVRLKSSQIFGEGTGVNLASNNAAGDYRWVFKTRDSAALSQVACVNVRPAKAVSPLFDNRKDWTGEVEPEGFSCVIVSPDACTAGWDWDKPTHSGEIASGYNPPRAMITDQSGDGALSLDEAYSLAKSETIPDPPVEVTAECRVAGIAESFSGYGLLTIDFTSPYVLDTFPGCGSACLNAAIGARFSKTMDSNPADDDSLNPTSLQQNTSLHICYDEPNCAPNAGNEVVSFPATISDDRSTNPNGTPTNTYVGYVPCVDYNGDTFDDYCLLPDTYYRVVIKGGVTESTGTYHLKGLNYPTTNPNAYSWMFKTKPNYGLCLPERIEIVPTQKEEDLNRLVLYSARGYTSPDRCEPESGQRLNPYSWSWGWNSVQASGWAGLACTSGVGLAPGLAALGSTAADLLGDIKTVPPQYYCAHGAALRNACGNTIIELGEECDDGNISGGDGCSASCNNEGTSACVNKASDRNCCGNAKVEVGEDCDETGAGCNASCVRPGNHTYDLQVCGNGFIDTNEECDPPGPGCGIVSGNNCRLTGSVSGQSLCGDGQIGLGEECDRGELADRTAYPSGPITGDVNGCSASCLIEDRTAANFCRSDVTGVINFSAGQCVGSCDPVSLPNHTCILLSNYPGNNTTAGSVCGNRVIETGEECDLGRICSDNGKPCTFYDERNCGPTGHCNDMSSIADTDPTGNVNIVTGLCSDKDAACNNLNKIGCDNPAKATCQPLGCSNICTISGSVIERTDPGRVGSYQIAQTLADGEAYLQSWLPAFAPNRGPFGEAKLTVGEGLGGEPGGPGFPQIIDRWPDCGSACTNADIGARFNQSMLASSLNQSNIYFYDCGGNRDCQVTRTTLPVLVNVSAYTITTTNPNDAFRISLPSSYNPIDGVASLLPNTTYRVLVTTGVLNLATPALTINELNYDFSGDQINDSYSWTFTTKPDPTLCALDSVGVQPAKLTLPDGGVRALYSVNPRSIPDQCDARGQRLDPYQFDWRWDDVEVQNINAAVFLSIKGNGCGNGVIEYGETCDSQPPDYEFPSGCSTVACRLTGSVSGQSLCGDGQIGVGEACDDGDRDTIPDGFSGQTPDYCNGQCLWTGNANYHEPVCGNGVIEYKAGTADQQEGEACDTGTEPNGNDADGCTDTCRYSGAVPGGDALCGDGQIGLGEECDGGELASGGTPVTGDANGCSGTSGEYPSGQTCSTASDQPTCQGEARRDRCYWTGNNCLPRPCLSEGRSGSVCRSDSTSVLDFNQDPAACPVGATARPLSWAAGNDHWNISVCGNGRREMGEECDDGNTVDSGDGCSANCLFNTPINANARRDPYRLVQTVGRLQPPVGFPLNADGLLEVKEEIRAWHDLEPNRVGVGELTVQGRPNVPFVVVGHQPEPNAQNQCRNVALWAILSQEVDPAVGIGSCSNDSSRSCGQSSDCAPDGSCQFSSFILDDCSDGSCTSTSDPTIDQNVAASISARPLSGQCNDQGHCVYAGTEFAESYCVASKDCRGTRLEITGVREGFLNANTSYKLFLNKTNIREAAGEQRSLNCSGSSVCSWTFTTNADFCQCDYLGVGIYNTHFGNEATDDLFTCAGDHCGEVPAGQPSIDRSKLDVDLALAGNQHRYEARCYDANNPQQTLIPISPSGLVFSWRDIDVVDDIISLTKQQGSGLLPLSDDQTHVTANGKNGLAYVQAAAQENRCTISGALCLPSSGSAGDCPAEAGDCSPQLAAIRQVEVTTFICENPWVYADSTSNCDVNSVDCLETNFELFYCRDKGAAGPADDLPALDSDAIVRGGEAGSQPIKDFIFPSTASNDAIGLRVIPNPLHLSADTWYRSGFCGGVQEIVYSCFSDDDCSRGNDCRLNVPAPGSPQSLVIDGYGAVRDGRSVYVHAANLDGTTLYSNIYILSYNQDASEQTVEIFSRLLDPEHQAGNWRFNINIPDLRVCSGDAAYQPGFFQGTKAACNVVQNLQGTTYRAVCQTHTATGRASCEGDTPNGCYWSDELGGCLARNCQEIACTNNFQCPTFDCSADQQKVIRDTKRYADLRDIQIAIQGATTPSLSAGSYVQGTSFSVWPSWQATLAAALNTQQLPVDPINRLQGCPGYACDGAGGAVCDPFSPAACNSQPEKCLVVDDDQAKTCWDEAAKRFSCPLDGFIYGYQVSGGSYDLYANFEYEGSGRWDNGSFEVPAGSSCSVLDFSVLGSGGPNVPTRTDCPAIGLTDADQDGICSNSDNCLYAYNPDQRDSGGASGLGDACDPNCSGDVDHDGVCDETDSCRTVYNPLTENCNGRHQTNDQCDADYDGIGDACDPCTDLDADGWWDINTGANDETICRRDNAPAGYCDAGSVNAGVVCSPVALCNGGSCQYDDVYKDSITYPPDGHPTAVRNFLASDRFGYCRDSRGNPIAQQRCCLASGQYSSGICNSLPACGAVACNGADFKTYNPNQEDFDGRKLGSTYLGDGIGYLADDCIDFDLDGFGDWRFYFKPTVPNWSWSNLSNNEKEHFQGCQGGVSPAAPGDFRGTFTPWQ